MLRIFNTENSRTRQTENPVAGCWVSLTDPSDSELAGIADSCSVDLADLRAPLDDEVVIINTASCIYSDYPCIKH